MQWRICWEGPGFQLKSQNRQPNLRWRPKKKKVVINFLSFFSLTATSLATSRTILIIIVIQIMHALFLLFVHVVAVINSPSLLIWITCNTLVLIVYIIITIHTLTNYHTHSQVDCNSNSFVENDHVHNAWNLCAICACDSLDTIQLAVQYS